MAGMKGGFDRDRAARILVDAVEMGDGPAAKKHGVSPRTLWNYRKRLGEDGAFAEAFRLKGIEAERGWHAARTRFLREIVEHLRSLCLQATPEQIDDVRKAVESVGNLDVASSALLPQSKPHDTRRPDPEGNPPPEFEGGGGQGDGPDRLGLQ